ncbi:ataxin-2-like protein isoform X1 [Seriola aureovittata]|uniref:ataxin-2-like protein isoform X1 n=2 Tax=Seriola aureovittata TaxID=2871759 RepID=UPI0024BE7FB8|nr:ataxin-2-like protein isoform X1 [Seriola aureovittata]
MIDSRKTSQWEKRTRNTMKPPSQTQSSPVNSLVFEGVYNNARMLHFLTAVVGSTCDVRVKNGAVYEGIFKTLSSQCELAVDAVHKRSDGDEGGGGEEGGGGSQTSAPKIEDITDTMIFSPTDMVTMTCRDVDLNFAVRDTFTDTAIGPSRVNGEHREKVLQRWDGDGNGENFELESDTSNGWDANEMFKFNEEAYGIKSTYDSSLSMYTMPLEKGNSEVYRQREARAARLAGEIEGSLQYRRRVSLENDEGRSEEDKYSSVVREREDRASPGFSSSGREGKYIPRTREIGLPARAGASGRSAAAAATSSRHPPPSSSSPKPPSDRSSPLSVRTAYSPHQSQSSPPAAGSPPCTNHVLPHSLSHPQALADTPRSSVNGVAMRTSPKSQRLQRNLRTPHSQSTPAVSRAPKPDAPPQDPPPGGPAYLDSSPSAVTTATTTITATTKPSGPTPLFPVDVNEILSSAAKERSESQSSPQDGKSSKAPSVQQRSQLEELRKFGKEFRLQPSSSPSASPASADPPQHSSAPPPDSSSSSSSSPGPPKPATSLASSAQDPQQASEAAPLTTTPAAPTPPAPPRPQSSGPEGAPPGSAQPTPTPSSGEEPCSESSERTEAVAAVQVKNSTLNPNAKEFLPIKGNVVLKPASTPTPPRPTPPSPSVVLPPPGQQGGGAIYSNPPGHYLSYVSPIPLQGHSIQAPQMYQYAMSTVNQGKYPRAKGPVVGPRPEHHASPASSMISAAASAAGPPLVASPYPLSYLQYGQVIQAMPPHYHGQTVYSMLQASTRMLTSGAPPQPMGPGPQYPGQAEGPGPQQAMYAPQAFSHHSGSIHHPQPSSTPTGNQPQHTAPSPGHSQSGQGGPQPQSMFHSGLSAPNPPNLPPGHSSPQASYTMQGYGLPTHQPLPHGFASISQLTQAHVTGGMSGPHHSAGHGPPPVMLHYAPPQQGGGSNPQHGPPPQQGAPQHFYIGPHQAVQVQAHAAQQLSFHPSAN